MARGVNKVILIGNLGSDPEVRYTQTGGAVCNISIATSDSWKDKGTGQTTISTEWHRVVAFNKVAEIIGKYLVKGSKAYIEGRLKTRKWKDNNGVERYVTEIVAENIEMLDARIKQENLSQEPMETTEPIEKNDSFDDEIPF